MQAFLLALFFLNSPVDAIEYLPWYPKEFQLQPEVTYGYQKYTRIASNHKNFHKPSYGSSLTRSTGIAYYDWYASLDAKLSGSTKRSFGYERINLEVRYQLLDDVAAVDPVSVIAGVTLTGGSKKALRDMSVFLHGRFEVEMHVAIGKEIEKNSHWSHRFWAVGALGLADVGSPWVHCKVQWDKNFEEVKRFSLFFDILYGFGGKALSKNQHFRGYGPIAHRSIDIGALFSFPIKDDIRFSLSAKYRLLAKNFPMQALSFYAQVLVPFGL